MLRKDRIPRPSPRRRTAAAPTPPPPASAEPPAAAAEGEPSRAGTSQARAGQTPALPPDRQLRRLAIIARYRKATLSRLSRLPHPGQPRQAHG